MWKELLPSRLHVQMAAAFNDMTFEQAAAGKPCAFLSTRADI